MPDVCYEDLKRISITLFFSSLVCMCFLAVALYLTSMTHIFAAHNRMTGTSLLNHIVRCEMNIDIPSRSWKY